jgi:uncharacterized MAPEG superfamily protein
VRKIGLVGLIILVSGALAMIVPARASQNAGSGARWTARPRASATGATPQAAAAGATVANDNFFTRTFNHFGNASLGSVIGETWLASGLNANFDAVNTQGVARAFLLPKALRVSLQVELRGADSNGNDQLVARSSKVNSAGKLTIQVATPKITLASDPRCFFYTLVHIGIRWSDGRLSTTTLEAPLGFTPGPTACPA